MGTDTVAAGRLPDAGRRPGTGAQRWRGVFPRGDDQPGAVRCWLQDLLPSCSARDDLAVVTHELCLEVLRQTVDADAGWIFAEISWAAAVVRVIVAGSTRPPAPTASIDPAGRDVVRFRVRIVRGLSVRCGISAPGQMLWADILWSGQDAPGPPQLPDSYQAVIRETEAALARQFPGWLIWFGAETLEWWALPRRGFGGLLAASSAGEMAQLLASAEAAWRPRPASGYARSPQQRPAGAPAGARLIAGQDQMGAEACLAVSVAAAPPSGGAPASGPGRRALSARSRAAAGVSCLPRRVTAALPGRPGSPRESLVPLPGPAR